MLWNQLAQEAPQIGWDFYGPVILFVVMIGLGVPIWSAISAAAIAMLLLYRAKRLRRQFQNEVIAAGKLTSTLDHFFNVTLAQVKRSDKVDPAHHNEHALLPAAESSGRRATMAFHGLGSLAQSWGSSLRHTSFHAVVAGAKPRGSVALGL